MKVYLSASYANVGQASELAKRLRDNGAIVTSRWHGPSPGETPLEKARMDIEDIHAADTLVYLSRMKSTQGGRDVEFGIAYERGLNLVLIGEPSNWFTYLPEVHRLTEDELINLVQKNQV